MSRTRSLLRREEYKLLSTLTLTGRVLDIGGSKKSGYHELLKGEHTITTVNIDAGYGTDLIFDAEKPWPIEDKSYDVVLFINVLEHLYGHRVALAEAHRVLSDKGAVHIVVPFMFNVHGSPNDYFRYTKSALTRLLEDAGFKDIEVQELGTGAFSVMYHALLALMPWRWLALPIAWLLTALDRLIARVKPGSSISASAMPLGYYATGRR